MLEVSKGDHSIVICYPQILPNDLLRRRRAFGRVDNRTLPMVLGYQGRRLPIQTVTKDEFAFKIER